MPGSARPRDDGSGQDAPERFESLPELLSRALSRSREAPLGEVATYIPELARRDPERLAIAACDLGGAVLTEGDADDEFTLQSISKPLLYASALDELGESRVHERVGVEPSGDAFDSVIRLDQATDRPHNPMINAGAIAVTGLLVEAGSGHIDRVLAVLGAAAGRELPGIDATVFLSERGAGHRNRAIAHLMRHVGVLKVAVDEALELYFQQCAAVVTCRDLAVMAATLAAGGRNPTTGERVFDRESVRRVLSVLSTCGLYDASGRFAFEVGLPAKTGVSGGVLVVAPGRLGLAAFAPGLDAQGNSVRGLVAVREVCRELGFHVFAPRLGRSGTDVGDQRLAAACRVATERAAAASGGAPAD